MSEVPDKALTSDPLAIQRRIRSASKKSLTAEKSNPAVELVASPPRGVDAEATKKKKKSKSKKNGEASVTVSTSELKKQKSKSSANAISEPKLGRSKSEVAQAERRDKKRQERKAQKAALRETSFASGFDDESVENRVMAGQEEKHVLASVNEVDDEEDNKHRSHDPPAMLKQSWDIIKLRGAFKVKVHECKNLAPPDPSLTGLNLSAVVKLDFTPRTVDWPSQRFKSPVAYYSGVNPRFRWSKEARLGGDEQYLEITVAHDQWYGDVVIGNAGLELSQLVRDNGRGRWWNISRTENGQVVPSGQVKLTCDYTPPLVLTIHRAKVIDRDDKFKSSPKLYVKIKSAGDKFKTESERSLTPEYEHASFLVIVDKHAEFDPTSTKMDPTDVQVDIWQDVSHGINKRIGGALIPAKILWDSIDQPAKWYEALSEDGRKCGLVQLSVLMYGNDPDDRRVLSRKEKHERKAAAGSGTSEAVEKKPKRRPQPAPATKAKVEQAAPAAALPPVVDPPRKVKSRSDKPVEEPEPIYKDSDDDLEIEVQKVLGPKTVVPAAANNTAKPSNSTTKPAERNEGRVVSVSLSGSWGGKNGDPDAVPPPKPKTKPAAPSVNGSVSKSAKPADSKPAVKVQSKASKHSRHGNKSESESDDSDEKQVIRSANGKSAKSPAGTTAKSGVAPLAQDDDDDDDDDDDAVAKQKPQKQNAATRRELMQAKRAQQKLAEEQRRQRRQKGKSTKHAFEPAASALSPYSYQEPEDADDSGKPDRSISPPIEVEDDDDAPL